MWLTGFDAPCLHTMYVDKPMRGHGLFQAITRVNRVFGDKPGGLVVDYLGLAQDIREATVHLHRKRRQGPSNGRSRRGGRRHAREARGSAAPSSTALTGRRGRPARVSSGWPCCPQRRSTFWRRRTAKNASPPPSGSCRRPSRWRRRMRRPGASGTTSPSSRRCALP